MDVFYLMATLFLMCGLPGSGKTTLAKQLEHEHKALRLCPDEWIAGILADPDDVVERDRLRDSVESLQWDIVKRALVLDVNVILENGFWSREERMRFRTEAESLGTRVELHYLKADISELWERLSKRNANLPPGTFVVKRDELETWYQWFEPPSEDEMPFLTHSL
jgi:predicted kinase